MQESITGLILDEYPVVRWAIRTFLEQGGINVLGEAQTIDEAIELAQILSPDVLIAEAAFSDGNLIDRLAELHSKSRLRVLVFSECTCRDIIEPILTAGINGFVSKREPIDELLAAVRAVAAGERWVSESVEHPEANEHQEDTLQLSGREREIVALVAEGFTSRQIADRLFISARTVENHRHRIFKKLGIKHCTQLADFAVRNGLRK